MAIRVFTRVFTKVSRKAAIHEYQAERCLVIHRELSINPTIMGDKPKKFLSLEFPPSTPLRLALPLIYPLIFAISLFTYQRQDGQSKGR